MKSFIYEICRWAAAAAAIFIIVSAADGTSSISKADPQDVLDTICKSVDMTNMQPAPNQTVKRFYGIEPSEYEFCALYYPLTNMDVDELLLIKFADSSQEQQVRTAAQSRLESQKEIFESYGVGQMELLNNHSVYKSDSGFAVFIINSRDNQAIAAFTDALRGK